MKISKNPLKTAYDSVRKTWKNFWNNDDAVGLTGLVLLILSFQGPIHEQPKNEFTIYKKFEPIQIEQEDQKDVFYKYFNFIEQENEYNKLLMKNFKDYINNLPEEERERIFGK